jgi:hypothetical protein
VCILLLVNPIGFLGGGQDDWQYLNAARCWRQFGPCLPHDHWQARWPVIAPIALLTSLFGESRITVSLGPLAASASALILVALVGNRQFGRPIGWIGALLLLATPAFAFQMLMPSVEATELALVFAGFLAIQKWQARPSSSAIFLSGLAFSLAVQVRETALVAALFAGVYAIVAYRTKLSSRHLFWGLCGFAIPFVVEFVTFWLATGDPLWRLRLSMDHTQIPSSELLGPIDRQHPPFFNKAYIANWRREAGIHVHWTVDGFLNLFFDAFAGVSLLFTPIGLVVGRRVLSVETRRKAWRLWLVGLLYMAVLIYAYAIDPKPRMMLVPIALDCFALGLVLDEAANRDRTAVVGAVAVSAALLILVLQFGHEETALAEPAARSWIASYPGQIEIDENTRRTLALVPGAGALPGVDSEEPLFLYASVEMCNNWVARRIPPGAQVIGAAAVSRLARFNSHLAAQICLIRLNQQIAGPELRDIIRRSRNDGLSFVGTRAL